MAVWGFAQCVIVDDKFDTMKALLARYCDEDWFCFRYESASFVLGLIRYDIL